MAYLLTLTDYRAKGEGAFVDVFTGKRSEHQTLMCAHCQMHWMVRPGSGTSRGFCMRCNAPTCGKQKCFDRCDPWEKRIMRAEANGSLERALRRIRES